MIRGRSRSCRMILRHRSREGIKVDESKSVMLSFRVSAQDERMIREAAQESGMSVSDWIRARIVGRL